MRTSLSITGLVIVLGCRGAAPGATFTDRFEDAPSRFATTGRSAWFILEPGYQATYEGGDERLVITVLADTELVDGVWTRVVEERETKGGDLVEVSRNYLAVSAATGNAYYFGEAVDMYENGALASHEGSWRSGLHGARFSLMMPSVPLLGARFQQEVAPGVAMDRVEVVSLDDSLTTPAGHFDHVLRTMETTPLEPMAREAKYYAPGVGLIRDGDLLLVRSGPSSQP